MNTTPAQRVTIGQHISSIPSVGTGRTTRTSGVVTGVETFDISGHQFTDIRIGSVRLTVSADSLVEVI